MRRGFTLTELLVVVAVIGVLAGLLLPMVAMVRCTAVRTACASNLRQVGMVVLDYAGENDDFLPAEGNYGIDDPQRSPAWFHRLPAQLGVRDIRGKSTIFQCAGFSWDGPRVFSNATPKSFKLNSYLDNDGRPRHYHLGSCSDEAQLVLFIDCVAKETGMGQWGYALTSAVDDSRHHGWVNVLFADGHTQAVVATPKDRDWSKAVRWRSEDW